MAQRPRALAVFAEDWLSGGSLSPITSVLGDPTPSSGLPRYLHACGVYEDRKAHIKS